MKRILCFSISLLLYPSLVLADGGTLRISQRCGDYQVSVFTSPAVLRAGLIDISVLVQDAATGQVRTNLPISIQLQSDEERSIQLQQPADASAATNKLFRAALFDVPRAGTWKASVLVGKIPVSFDFAVAPPPPAWLALAPWIGWPFVLAALFLWHQRLVWRREVRRRPAPNLHATQWRPSVGTTAYR